MKLMCIATATVSERRSPIGYKRFMNSGHRDNRTLVRLLKQRGTHPRVLKMATEHRCSACEESRPPVLRHITSSYENVPGAILEVDGMHWQHPVTGRHARCQFMVDVGSRAPMITVFEETRERSTRNNQTSECKESLLKDWFVHRGRPRLVRMDPDGYMSNEMLGTLHNDLGINTEVIPGEAPWKLSITGVSMRLVKRTAHNYALDQGRDASCQECLLQAVMAHSRLLKHGGYTPLQLLFGHEPAPIEGEDWQDSSQPCRCGCKPKPNLASNEHRNDVHALFNTGPLELVFATGESTFRVWVLCPRFGRDLLHF